MNSKSIKDLKYIIKLICTGEIKMTNIQIYLNRNIIKRPCSYISEYLEVKTFQEIKMKDLSYYS